MLYCTIDNIEWEKGYSEPPYFVNKLPHVVYYTPSPIKNKRNCKCQKKHSH